MAALESQIDKQKREIDSLHKALSLSDNRIEKLQPQITTCTITTASHKGVYHVIHEKAFISINSRHFRYLRAVDLKNGSSIQFHI